MRMDGDRARRFGEEDEEYFGGFYLGGDSRLVCD